MHAPVMQLFCKQKLLTKAVQAEQHPMTVLVLKIGQVSSVPPAGWSDSLPTAKLEMRAHQGGGLQGQACLAKHPPQHCAPGRSNKESTCQHNPREYHL